MHSYYYLSIDRPCKLQETFATIIETVHCDLAVAKETFYPRNLAFIVPKDWPYKDLFNTGWVKF